MGPPSAQLTPIAAALSPTISYTSCLCIYTSCPVQTVRLLNVGVLHLAHPRTPRVSRVVAGGVPRVNPEAG